MQFYKNRLQTQNEAMKELHQKKQIYKNQLKNADMAKIVKFINKWKKQKAIEQRKKLHSKLFRSTPDPLLHRR